MANPTSDVGHIAARAIELHGGSDAFFAAADQEINEINVRWHQDITMIGRILRSHLFVEHYLSMYLAKVNPRLGSLADARITFAQKVALLDTSNVDISTVLQGIKRLNTIRNRLAHNLSAQVTEEDSQVFLRSERFAALRMAKAMREVIGNEPIDILEDFSLHTSIVFTNGFSSVSRAIKDAIREVHACDKDIF